LWCKTSRVSLAKIVLSPPTQPPVTRAVRFIQAVQHQPSQTSEVSRLKRTLTNFYNARPTWLNLAHEKLDEAVSAAYGWKHDLSDEEILEKLLALNLERAKG
jgi:hypothetical protein